MIPHHLIPVVVSCAGGRSSHLSRLSTVKMREAKDLGGALIRLHSASFNIDQLGGRFNWLGGKAKTS